MNNEELGIVLLCASIVLVGVIVDRVRASAQYSHRRIDALESRVAALEARDE